MDLLTIAEMKFDERRNMLGLALQKSAVNLHVRDFVMWVFNSTAGGNNGRLIKSYKELGYHPWGLCCSAATAKRAAHKAEQLGLIDKTENVYVSEGQRANGYEIDWHGVRRLLGFPVESASFVGDDSQSGSANFQERNWTDFSAPPGQDDQPPGQDDQPPGQDDQPSNRNSSLTLLFEKPVPVPVPGSRAPMAVLDFEIPKAIRDWPEIAPLIDRTVSPLPLKFLRPGLAWRFWTAERLRDPKAARCWFGEQLSLPEPIFPGTVVWMLLVMATANHAATVHDREIKRTRVQYFVHNCSRHFWGRSLHRLPDAIEQYENWKAEA